MISLAPINIDPPSFWREHQYKFPILASVARDVFSIPATGAGVERLFNSARDICHYRRGSLNATTIQDIMMFRCLSRFDIKDEQEIDAALTQDERHIADEREEESDQLPQCTPDPISDDEEDEPPATEPASQFQPEVPSERALGKRRKSVASVDEIDIQEIDDDDDDDSNLPLPKHQQRMSGRARKRPRQDGFEMY